MAIVGNEMSHSLVLKDRVVIVGASLAGAMAAFCLGQAGVPVLLVDRDAFPRRKPCGEGLSARGQHELVLAGTSLQKLGCSYQKLSGYRVYRGSASSDIPETSGLVGISRSEFDGKLVARVGELASAQIIQGKSARVVCANRGAFSIAVGRDTFSTRWLVVADGASSPTLRTLGRRPTKTVSPRLGISSRWGVVGGPLEPMVHTVLMPGGEFYLTPLPGGEVNVSALGVRSMVEPLWQEGTLHSRVNAVADIVGVSLRPLKRGLSCGPINSLYRGAQCLGAFIVGDACETFDPCAGFGMTHALLTGRLAAHHILRALEGSEKSSVLASYEREREKLVRDVRGFTRLTFFAMTSALGRLSLPLLVSSGLAGRMSESVHGAQNSNRWRHLISIMGARFGRGPCPFEESMSPHRI